MDAPPASRHIDAPPAASQGTIECQICFDTVPFADAMALCAKGHAFCAECCWRCCRSAVDDGLVPACPSNKEHSCGSVTKEIAEHALSKWLGAKGQSQSRKTEMGALWGLRGSIAGGFTSRKMDEVYLSAERAKQGAVQCTGRKCTAWYVPDVPHSSQPQRIMCTIAKCSTAFCAACRHPYHFRSTCAEALRINARWIKFLQEELAPFLTAAIKTDPDRYSPALKEHTRSKSALDGVTKEALQRFDELKKMELWKERHCRHCPHCQRIVHRMSGW